MLPLIKNNYWPAFTGIHFHLHDFRLAAMDDKQLIFPITQSVDLKCFVSIRIIIVCAPSGRDIKDTCRLLSAMQRILMIVRIQIIITIFSAGLKYSPRSESSTHAWGDR